LHEVVEYLPSVMEWKITAGIWALGLMIYTVAIKVTINVIGAGRKRFSVLPPEA